MVLTDICGPINHELLAAAKTVEVPPPSNPLIEAVKNVFPELGEGFIEACLEVYDNNVERVVQNILEETLTTELKKLDRKMQRQSTFHAVKPVEKKEKKEDLLKNRHNVFSNDEFDVMSNDRVDTSKFYRQK